MRAAFIACAVWLASAATALAQMPAERCGVIIQDEAGAITTEFVTGFFVTGVAPFALPDEREGVRAVICEREMLAIGEDDYRVITDAGLPIYVASGGRTIVLEVSGGQFRARVTRGELTNEERANLGVALSRAQSAAQGGQ